MTPEARQQAAQHFWQHLDSGQLNTELPEAQRPQTEAEGHACLLYTSDAADE